MTTFSALANLIETHYVLADLAPEYAARVRTHQAELEQLLSDATAANAALHALVPDKHLGLRTAPVDAQPRTTPRAGGFATIEQIDGGTVLVRIHPWFTAPDDARPYLEAVARLASEADALVLDLRECFGGDTNTTALIHGWLLGSDPVHLGHFEHRGKPDVEYISDPSVELHFTGSLRVLTSAATFSGAEDLAYVLQAVGRARVVGEQTAGGAHPVEHFDLPGGRVCQIPVARSVIAATGTNWEGVGVTPDVECPADDALAAALRDLPN